MTRASDATTEAIARAAYHEHAACGCGADSGHAIAIGAYMLIASEHPDADRIWQSNSVANRTLRESAQWRIWWALDCLRARRQPATATAFVCDSEALL